MSKDQRGRTDPVLKLYPGCPMMLTQNKDVPNGQANGSRVIVLCVTTKIGEHSFPLTLDCGTIIPALFASQVDSILVEHTNPDIIPSSFLVTHKSWPFQASIKIGGAKIKADMRGQQFPIISNSATTGHKLQGCSLDQLLVNDWEYKYNWAYVVLSRVRTMAGLYLQQPLSEDLEKYRMPQAMTDMLRSFEENKALQAISDSEYAAMESAFDNC